MNECPCCSSSLLRHIDHNRVYWYCLYCHQEMPNFSLEIAHRKLNHCVPRVFNPDWHLTKLALSSRIPLKFDILPS